MLTRRACFPAVAFALAVCSFRCGQAADLDEAALSGDKAPKGAIWLDSLDLSKIDQDWGQPHAGRSVENHPLTLHGKVYRHGVGTHAASEFNIDLDGAAEKFVTFVGADDETPQKGSVSFQILVDGKKVAESGRMETGDAPKRLEADLRGAKHLGLTVGDCDDGNSFDHADWAGAVIVMVKGSKARLKSIGFPDSAAPEIVSQDPQQPAIHDPRIVGTTPGRPFLFLVPVTGEKPITFAAKNIPEGLALDASTGIITGSLKQSGTTTVELEATNARGSSKRELTIVGGEHKLALTPPMGWNSWNCWASAVSDAKVRAAADAMAKSGLAAHGFQYVNIDDCWEGRRNAEGEIQSNQKFPDMKALADYVHSKGLKLGIYSSPGPRTCAGFEASWQHEAQDARTYARWGVDYLKYDWCSYGGIAPHPDRAGLMKPYQVMRQGLDECGRDIVYSLCQYGMGDVWTWGAEVGGNCWRTTGDINDSWGSMSGIGFGQDGHEKYAAPGHWNDPDMLVLGKVGWGPALHPTKLRPNEQLTHISLWCLLSSPLLIGCDMSSIDPFTLALLTNDEVLDIDQDPLGKPAARIAKTGSTEVWARPLYDGTTAVGLFNRGRQEAKVKVQWSDLKRVGPQAVRDLWQHKDLGEQADGYEVSIPPHGVVLVKVGKAK